jgi:DNA segregation ATPase FtsK/SpoIIIE-like protein
LALALSTPLKINTTHGLRYDFRLSVERSGPRLPQSVEFPGAERGQALLGVCKGEKVLAAPWDDLGHLLVAGMTGSGKSNFLRLLAYQALGEGAQLLIADLDGATFPMLAEHSALMVPIVNTPGGVADLVAAALEECDHRSQLYVKSPGFPEKLEEYNVIGGIDPLPRVLVILDEYNATVNALGGANGKFAGDVGALAMRGRKFGVHVALAAQDFAKSVVGRVRDQVAAAVCFRVRSPETARNVGCTGAHQIPESLPGRAITDRWGPIQAYFLPKDLLVEAAPPPLLQPWEIELVRLALERNNGQMSRPFIVQNSHLSHQAAKQLHTEWRERGWLEQGERNAHFVSSVLKALVVQLS